MYEDLKTSTDPSLRSRIFFTYLKTSFLNVLKPKLDALSKTGIQVVLNTTVVVFRTSVYMLNIVRSASSKTSSRLVWKIGPQDVYEDLKISTEKSSYRPSSILWPVVYLWMVQRQRPIIAMAIRQ